MRRGHPSPCRGSGLTPSRAPITLQSVAVFMLAGLLEIGGGWLVWQSLRTHAPAPLAPARLVVAAYAHPSHLAPIPCRRESSRNPPECEVRHTKNQTQIPVLGAQARASRHGGERSVASSWRDTESSPRGSRMSLTLGASMQRTGVCLVPRPWLALLPFRPLSPLLLHDLCPERHFSAIHFQG